MNAGKGLLFSLEGIDGTGKSTQIQRISELLGTRGHDVLVLREPGGSRVSEGIRELLLNPAHETMCDESEILLYTASRLQLLREIILPALAEDRTVLLDRFADSTTAYQGYGRGLDAALVETMNGLVRHLAWPDRTWWLDLEPERALARSSGSDRLEQAPTAFFQRTAQGYARICEAEPERVCRIDASGSPDMVFSQIREDLEDLLKRRKDDR